MYSSLDADEGLYWAYETAGHVERLVSPGDIERRVYEPPDDTRAWLRGRLLGMAEPGEVLAVDWDHIRTRRGTILLTDPRQGTREEYESVLVPGLTLDDLMDDLTVAESAAVASSWAPAPVDHSRSVAPVREITMEDHDGEGGDDVRT